MSRVDITVGLSVSLSGRFRLLRAALQGFLLWQSYINAQGGIAVQNGEKKPVRLIWYDDRSQISCARSNVTRLLREDQIDIALRAVLQQLDDGGGDH
jgi:ABC-type branched-subunit amino acid transport system substrate-binding protein